MIQFQSKFRSIRIITRTSPSTLHWTFPSSSILYVPTSSIPLLPIYPIYNLLFANRIFGKYFSPRIDLFNAKKRRRDSSNGNSMISRICVYLVGETSENFKGTGSVRTCFINFELGHEDVQFSAREGRIPRSPPLSPPVQPSSIALFIRVQNSLTLPERLEHLLLLSPGL